MFERAAFQSPVQISQLFEIDCTLVNDLLNQTGSSLLGAYILMTNTVKRFAIDNSKIILQN